MPLFCLLDGVLLSRIKRFTYWLTYVARGVVGMCLRARHARWTYQDDSCESKEPLDGGQAVA